MKKSLNKIWKLFLYYTFCVMLFTSCVTEKQRKKICAECKSASFDSTKTETITKIKDTTIYINSLPVIQFVKSPCDSLGNLKDFNITKSENGVKSVVKNVGGVLFVECKTDSLKAKISLLEREIKTTSKQKEVKEITTNILTWFQKFCIKWFWVTASVILIWCVWRLVKIYLKTLI